MHDFMDLGHHFEGEDKQKLICSPVLGNIKVTGSKYKYEKLMITLFYCVVLLTFV